MAHLDPDMGPCGPIDPCIGPYCVLDPLITTNCPKAVSTAAKLSLARSQNVLGVDRPRRDSGVLRRTRMEDKNSAIFKITVGRAENTFFSNFA